MIIEIRSPNMELDQSLLEWTQRRLGFALGRFADRVRRVRVTLHDANGSRGGLDKECLMTAYLVAGGPVIAEITDSEFESAVTRAAKRLARRLAMGTERKRDLRRHAKKNRVEPGRPEDLG